jgi:hypothetical protein
MDELVLPRVFVQLLLLLLVSSSSSSSLVGVLFVLSFIFRVLLNVFCLCIGFLLVGLLLAFAFLFLLDSFSTTSSSAGLSGALLSFFDLYLLLWLLRIRLVAFFTVFSLLILH